MYMFQVHQHPPQPPPDEVEWYVVHKVKKYRYYTFGACRIHYQLSTESL